MHGYKYYLSILFIFLFLPAKAFSNEETLKFYAVYSYPWGYIEDGIQKGIMVDWAKLILQKANLSGEITLAPYARIIKNLETGEAGITSLIINEKLEKNAILISSSVSQPAGLLTLKRNPISQTEDLKGKVVCQINGGFYSKSYENESEITKYKVADYEQMMKMLNLGRCFAALGLINSLYAQAKLLKIPLTRFSPPLILKQVTGGIYLSKIHSSPDRINRLKQAMEVIHKNNGLKKIVNKYNN